MTTNLLFVLRRRWPILVVVPLLTVIAVIALSPAQSRGETRYTSTLYLAGDPDVLGSVSLEQAAVEVKQRDVAAIAAENMEEEPEDLEDFASAITTKADPDALSLKLTATDTDRARVRPYLEAFAAAFITVDDQRLNEQYMQLRQDAVDADEKATQVLNDFLVANAAALAAVPPDPVALARQETLEGAQVQAATRLAQVEEERPASAYRITGSDRVREVSGKLTLPASKGLRAGMALILAILGSIGLIALIERLNPRIDSPDDAEAIVGAPVLAMVPIMRGKRRHLLERVTLEQFSGPFAESFRAMRSHLDFRRSAEGLEHPPCVMIVSSAPGEGKTTSSAFLALSFAEAGREVVIVGADFRRPSVHRLFGLESRPGLSSRLVNPRSIANTEDAVRSIVKRDNVTGVRVIPSGPATDRVTGLLGDMTAVISAAVDSGCTVVVDTAPIMVANDAIDFLPLVDWVVVVVRVGTTTERSLRQTITSLELNNAKIAGCVMVGSLESSDAKRYYYSYYRVDPVTEADGLPKPEEAAPQAEPQPSAPA